MNFRTTWLLVLAALGLGAYLYVSDRTPAVRVDGLAGPRVPFTPVVVQQVQAIEVLRSNTVVRIERDGENWRVRLPVADAADRMVVEAFLRNLGRLKPKNWIPSRQIDAGSGGLSAFGLDASAVTLKVEGGPQPAFFKLGGRAPIGEGFYFQRVGDDGVFTADAALLDSLPEGASGWRNRALFSVPATAIERVELRGRTQFEARRFPRPGGSGASEWRLIRPIEARANGDRMEALVGLLQRARIAEFVSDTPGADLERFGLQPPESELILSGASNALVHLQIGRSPSNSPSLVYVRRMAATNVVLIPATALLPLQGTLSTFRDRRLVPPVQASQRLEFTSSGRSNALERTGTNWWIAGTPRLPARTDLVEFFLGRMEALEIADFPNDVVADYSRYGLATPSRVYGFHDSSSNSAPLRLLFGEGSDRESQMIFARRGDESPVYALRRADVARLPESALQFRDFRFASTNVQKVVTVHRGRTRTLERSATGEWLVTAGVSGAPFSPAAEETLHRVGLLQTIPFTIANESLFIARPSFTEIGLEVTLHLDSFAPLRKLRLRFVVDLGSLAVALVNFEDDPVSYSLELPGPLYREILRDFSVIPRE